MWFQSFMHLSVIPVSWPLSVKDTGLTAEWVTSHIWCRHTNETTYLESSLSFSFLVFLWVQFLLGSNILVWHSPMPFLNVCAVPVIDEWPYKNSRELTTPPSLDQLQGCWLRRESLTGTCIKQMPNKVSQQHKQTFWGMGFMMLIQQTVSHSDSGTIRSCAGHQLTNKIH